MSIQTKILTVEYRNQDGEQEVQSPILIHPTGEFLGLVQTLRKELLFGTVIRSQQPSMIAGVIANDAIVMGRVYRREDAHPDIVKAELSPLSIYQYLGTAGAYQEPCQPTATLYDALMENYERLRTEHAPLDAVCRDFITSIKKYSDALQEKSGRAGVEIEERQYI